MKMRWSNGDFENFKVLLALHSKLWLFQSNWARTLIFYTNFTKFANILRIYFNRADWTVFSRLQNVQVATCFRSQAIIFQENADLGQNIMFYIVPAQFNLKKLNWFCYSKVWNSSYTISFGHRLLVQKPAQFRNCMQIGQNSPSLQSISVFFYETF